MRAIMLAAGRGTRLFGELHEEPPKSLLRFDGDTLLRRHLELLHRLGLEQLCLVLGYQADLLHKELEEIGLGPFVQTRFNPDFREGAVVSLWCARDVLRAGDDVLFMDADVLYHPGLLERLVEAPVENGLLFDAHFEPGEDPVMACLKGGSLVDFGKQVSGRFDAVGEWPGFLKLGPETAARLSDAVEATVARGGRMEPYEPTLREVMLAPGGRPFGIVDVSDLPWIEIDFPEDLERAQGEIMPRLRASRSAGRSAG